MNDIYELAGGDLRVTEGLKTLDAVAKSGALRLLTAFYTAPGPLDEATYQYTYEFTHKSFGEYLTARRLIDAFGRAVATCGDDISSFLRNWSLALRRGELDLDLAEFISGEMLTKDAGLLRDWQAHLDQVFNLVVKQGVPLELLEGNTLTAKIESDRKIQASLLCVHSAVAAATGERSEAWGDGETLGVWLAHVTNSYNDEFALSNLNHLHLGTAQLRGAAFNGANLSYSNLGGALLSGAQLVRTKLSSTDFGGAVMTGIRVEDVKFVDCNFQGANLNSSFWYAVQLRNCNLTRVDCSHPTYFKDVSFLGSDLSAARFTSSCFINATFSEIPDGESAVWRGASLRGSFMQTRTPDALVKQLSLTQIKELDSLISSQETDIKGLFTQSDLTHLMTNNPRLFEKPIWFEFQKRSEKA